MFETFRQDAARWIEPGKVGNPDDVTFWTALRLLFRHLSLRAVGSYRVGVWCRAHRIPFVFGYVLRRNLRCYGLELSTQDGCGGGLYIAHPVGSVINARSIGSNVSVISAVTVGMRNEWAFPTIGNDVFIGTGARVLGGIALGDGAVVGANAVVITDVPARATAVGIPARVIRVAGARTGA